MTESRPMTNCTRYENDLKAYADGELPPLRRLAVRRHLTRCLLCRKEILAMTQVTEDLRASEPEDALPPDLREKILAEPGRPLAPNNGGAGAASNPSGSPMIGGGGASSRRLPAWAFAALAVIAWFVCFPLFQHVRENSRRIVVTAADTAPVSTESQMALPPSVKHRPLAAPQAFSANAVAPPLPIRAVPPPKPVTVQPPAPHIPAPPPDIPAPAPRVVASNFGARSLSVVPALPDTDTDSLRQVHKEAGIGLQVPNPDATGDKINDMVKETGGYVAANNLSTDPDGRKSGEMIVKVPEPQFETFLAEVAKLGTVVSKNITGEDITEKTSDATQAQIVQENDLQQAEARLKSLGSHAKWEDTQNAEDLRVQLAQTRARLKLLKRLAALGTLTIDLSQPPKAALPPPVTSGFTGSLKATTHDAVQSLVGSAGALLALVIWLLAYAPIWIPLLLLGRYALKEYRKREALANPPD